MGFRYFFSVFSAACALVALSGCGGEIGGDGQMSDGDPLSVMLVVEMTSEGPLTTVDIASPAGWTCRSPMENAREQTSIRKTFPMTCSDGASGTLVSTWDELQMRQHGAFKLDDGRTGKFVINFKR